MIKVDEFTRHIAGFHISDCLVTSGNRYALLLLEDYSQWTDWEETGHYPSTEALEHRVIWFEPDGLKQWRGRWITGLDTAYIAMNYTPEEELVICDIGGKVYSWKGSQWNFEDRIEKDRETGLRGGVRKLKVIGKRLLLCGGWRTAGIRRGDKNWHWLTSEMRFSEEEWNSNSFNFGFDDIDGFAEDDIYAVGGKGDVWHYDGDRWRQMDFPSNSTLDAVCCGEDGNVYIGSLELEYLGFVGRDNAWKKITGPQMSLPFKDMVWYEGKVWCTNDYGVWWIEDDRVVEADIPSSAKICAGNLSVHEGVLMLAGLYGAAFLKNGEWHTIYHYGKMMDQCREEGKLEGVLRARWHEFTKDGLPGM